jgi:hypothetical protein
MRTAEGNLVQRVRSRRAVRPDGIALSPQVEQTIEEILVAREMVRVDLGVDVMIAQPRS